MAEDFHETMNEIRLLTDLIRDLELLMDNEEEHKEFVRDNIYASSLDTPEKLRIAQQIVVDKIETFL